MSRRYLSATIDDLEAVLEDAIAAGNGATIDDIADELSHRKMPRARDLQKRIADLRGTARPSPRQQRRPGAGPAMNRSSKASHRPTDEQQSAIDAFLKASSLKINAYAGTGKTSTLEMIAHSTPKRGQYIAFNRKIVEEAKQRFPAHVNCSTSHGLAYKANVARFGSGEKMTGKIGSQKLAELLDLNRNWRIDKDHSLQPRSQAFIILDTVKQFAMSGADEILSEHVRRHGSLLTASDEVIREVADFAVRGARHVWSRMIDASDPMPLGHDGYLKLWALGKPIIAADYVLLDEAQDTNPVVLEVLRAQAAQMIYVGDRYQQIYEWRGAVNAMEKIETSATVRLTQSFRFGDRIAEAATSILRQLGETVPLIGNPRVQSRIGPCDPDTVLARTNGTTMSALVDALNADRKPHLVGGTAELKEMLKGVQDLKNRIPSTVPEFFGFENWGQVVDFSKTPEGEHLITFVNLVESRGEKQLLWALNRVVDEADSDLIISTAHKAKGREWGKVELRDDFLKSRARRPTPPDAAKPEQEQEDASEKRLFYVAMTRAKEAVDIPAPVAATFGISMSPSPRPASPQPEPSVRTEPAVPRPQVSPKPAWKPPSDWQPPKSEPPAARKPLSPQPEPARQPPPTQTKPEAPKRGFFAKLFGL